MFAAHGQEAQTALCQTGYSVFFGNGILADFASYNTSIARIEATFGTTYEGNPITKYQISLNPTDELFRDLLEAFSQKLAEDPTLSWQLFFRWASGQFINQALATVFSDYIGVNGAQKIAQAATRLSSPVAFSDRTVVDHASTYKSELLAGQRVLLVAHSQGNLYANAVYRKLLSEPSTDYNLNAFGIAAVATPANSVATNDTYVTSDTDLIMQVVRVVAPATLSSNDSSVPLFPAGDRFGHGFNEIYYSLTRYSELRFHTGHVMETTLSRIAAVATTTSANGPITATLTWNSPADVDLHTFEPTAHVYYANLRGPVGFLDRDDTRGTGPEHYFASCSGFREGEYSFGVNYYSGSGPKTASVKASILGVNYPARSIVLTSPEGRSGDSSPAILFRVTIGKDTNGKFNATVR